MLGRTRFPAIGELPYMITLAPYGFYWFQLKERDKSEHSRRAWSRNSRPWWYLSAATWVSLARTRGVFERDVLPTYLARTRWYPERSAREIRPTLTSAIPFCDIGDNRPWLAFFEATQRGETTRYVLPMRIEWVRFDRERYNPRALRRYARARAKERCWMSPPTRFSSRFCCAISGNRLTVEEQERAAGIQADEQASGQPFKPPEHIRAVETEQSNSTALVDNDYVVKIYRKLEPGINPEIEVGRFLTEVAGFANTPALLGTVELVEGDKQQRGRRRPCLCRKIRATPGP